MLIVSLPILWLAPRAHQRWVGLRSLAEAFRSGLFIALTDVGPRAARTDPIGLGERNESWFQRAFSEAWRQRPSVAFDALTVAELRRFLAEEWIEDQIAYHRTAERRYKHWRSVFRWTIAAALLLAMSVAIIHASGLIERRWFSHILVFLAIVLPAWGAALAGLREQGQWSLHEERSRSTVRRLTLIKHRLATCEDREGVRQLGADAQDVMVEENLDWSGVIEFQNLEVVV